MHGFRECQTDHDWWDCTCELWTNALNQIGFENAKINSTGFWPQGAGACFTASVDVVKLARFLGTEYEVTDTIPASDHEGGEDFRGWIVKQIGGKNTNRRYRKLTLAVNYIDAEVKRISHHYGHGNI